MAILRFEAVRREIGTFVILDDVSAAVAHGERIGLVGINGAGKTTLLRLAAGTDSPDGGRVVRKAGLTVGLLSQEANLDAAFAAAPDLRTAVRSGAADLEADERELARLEAAGAEGVASAAYAEARHRFEARDGYGLDQRVEATLSGLGFETADLDRPPTSLSGGEQTRAALARLLIADPDLLLLDEPTNHLDVAAIEWLEQALARRDRAVIVASHDRAFLDAVVQRIWELRDRHLRVFRGAFSAYLTQREAADARAHKDAESHADAVAREQELVQRYRSHRKYAKMHEHERRLDALREAPVEAPKRRPSLALSSRGLGGDGAVRSGDLVVSVRDVVVGFPASPAGDPIAIARAPRLEAQRGERIGIVGPNGAGKTTLLRTIAGDLAPLEGIVRLGAAVQPGYLAQLRQAAFTGQTVLDAAGRLGPRRTGRGALVPGSLPVPRRRRVQAGVRAVGRRAVAPRAGRPGRQRGQPAAARRAHQPPRHPRPGGSRSVPAPGQRHAPRRVARPPPPRERLPAAVGRGGRTRRRTGLDRAVRWRLARLARGRRRWLDRGRRAGAAGPPVRWRTGRQGRGGASRRSRPSRHRSRWRSRPEPGGGSRCPRTRTGASGPWSTPT